MPDDPIVHFRGKDGPIPVRLVRNPHPEITITSTALHERDGVKPGDIPSNVQIVEDSRGRHRGVVPGGESASYKLRDHEVVDVTERRDAHGEKSYTYHLRRKPTED